MRNPLVLVLTMSARLSGLLALVLGAAYWGGFDIPLHVHMAVGLLLTLSLWGLAARVWTRGSALLAVVAWVWGIVVPALGLGQIHLSVYLPHAQSYWILHVLHVASGLGAIAFAEIMTKRLRIEGELGRQESSL